MSATFNLKLSFLGRFLETNIYILTLRSQHINLSTSLEASQKKLNLKCIILATLLIYIDFHERPFESHSHGVHGVNASVSNYN